MSCKIIKHKWPLPLESVGPVDLIFADPPYDIGVDYDGDETKDKRGEAAYLKFCWTTSRQLMEMLKPGGTLWWLCDAKDTMTLTCIAQGTLLYGAPIIWHERFSQYQQKRLTRDYRLLFPIVKPGADPTFNPDDIRIESERQKMGDKRADPRGRVPGHVWEFDVPMNLANDAYELVDSVWRVRRLQGTSNDRVKWHPAQLPPEPLERIVKGWTNKRDIVLDAFAGSGNMGLACQKLSRDCVLVDQSEKYCQGMDERLFGRGPDYYDG